MRMSSTITSPSAAPTSVPSIVSKTSLASAETPAGPLTLASSPPGALSTTSR
jgi:hypothetical protein